MILCYIYKYTVRFIYISLRRNKNLKLEAVIEKKKRGERATYV